MNETLDLTRMRASARTVTALLRALSNEDRLLLLWQISRGEKNVHGVRKILTFNTADFTCY